VYPGPIGAILTPQLDGIAKHASLPFASSLCGACYEVCPVKIDIPRVLLHLRARAVEAKGGAAERTAMGLAAWTFGSSRRFELAQRLSAGPLRLRSRSGALRKLPFPLSGWTRTRDLKWPAQGSFRDWWRRR
jgi:L-lactate dehydrogenase complex protein LldF